MNYSKDKIELERTITAFFKKNRRQENATELQEIIAEANQTFNGLVRTGNHTESSAKITKEAMKKLILQNQN